MPDDAATPDAVLAYVKSQLGVTWEDTATDERYAQLIADGKAYLDDKLGAPGDYESPGYARELLKEYVRYARDAALDVFETNYTARILAMQNQRRVNAYGASLEASVPGE